MDGLPLGPEAPAEPIAMSLPNSFYSANKVCPRNNVTPDSSTDSQCGDTGESCCLANIVNIANQESNHVEYSPKMDELKKKFFTD